MAGFSRSPSLAIGTDSPSPRRSRSKCLATGRAAFGTPEDPETSFLRAIDNLRQRTIGVSYTAAVNADLGVHQDRFYATVAVNETEFKGKVFTAVTIEWAHGLYRNGGPVAQITRNVLNRLGS